jgi:hypothetical protein
VNARILGRPRVPTVSGEIVITDDGHWFTLWRDLEGDLMFRASIELARGRFVRATKLGHRKERARARARAALGRMMRSGGAPCGG